MVPPMRKVGCVYHRRLSGNPAQLLRPAANGAFNKAVILDRYAYRVAIINVTLLYRAGMTTSRWLIFSVEELDT